MNHGSRRLTWKNYVAYGIGDIYGGGAFTLLNLLFLNFLTDVALLPATLAGVVLMVGNVWDGGIDPFLGMLTDRTRSRFGRRRIYFLVGIVPIALTFVLLWTPVGGSNLFKLCFYTAAYLLFALAFSVVMVPYNALAAEMTEDHRERNKLTGTRMGFSNFSSLLAGVLPMIIVSAVAGTNPGRAALQRGYVAMGLAFGILYALPWIAVFKGTWERTGVAISPFPKGLSVTREFIADLIKTLRNRSFRIHIGLYLFGYAALDFLMVLAMYFVSYFLGQKQHFSIVLGALVIVQMAGLPLYVWISDRFGKKQAFIAGSVFWSLALLSTLFMKPGQAWYLVVIMAAVAGLGASGIAYVPWAILPEVTDVDELISGSRREGVYAGYMSFLRKAAQALATLSIGILLDVIGYIPNAAQNPQTLRYLQFLFGLGPVILMAAAVAFAWRYPVTPENHRLLIEELKRRRAGDCSGNASSETAAACETVTGYPS